MIGVLRTFFKRFQQLLIGQEQFFLVKVANVNAIVLRFQDALTNCNRLNIYIFNYGRT